MPTPARSSTRGAARRTAPSAGGRSIKHLGRDLRKLTVAEIRRVTLAVYRQSVKESPVGKPRLWKSKRRPKGYVGGTFRRSWFRQVFADKLLGFVGNPRRYAVPLTHRGHSKQVPRPWWIPMVRRVLREASAKPLSWKRTIFGGGSVGTLFGRKGSR